MVLSKLVSAVPLRGGAAVRLLLYTVLRSVSYMDGGFFFVCSPVFVNTGASFQGTFT